MQNKDNKETVVQMADGKKTVLIITGGDKPDYADIADKITAADIIICADSGGDYAYHHGIRPDYLLGDFDSISTEAKDFFLIQGVPLEAVPTEKDFTDTQMALDLAIKFAPETIYLCGGWGSRADHSLVNIFLLCKYLSKVSSLILLGKGFYGYYSLGVLDIMGVPGQTVSLIPLAGEVRNLSLEGFYYPLESFTLPWGSSRGVSNVLVSHCGKIRHESGILLVIQHIGSVE